MGELEPLGYGQRELIWFVVGLVLLNLAFMWWVAKRVRAHGQRLDAHDSAINRLRSKNASLGERVSEWEFRQTIAPAAPRPALPPRKPQRR